MVRDTLDVLSMCQDFDLICLKSEQDGGLENAKGMAKLFGRQSTLSLSNSRESGPVG